MVRWQPRTMKTCPYRVLPCREAHCTQTTRIPLRGRTRVWAGPTPRRLWRSWREIRMAHRAGMRSIRPPPVDGDRISSRFAPWSPPLGVPHGPARPQGSAPPLRALAAQTLTVRALCRDVAGVAAVRPRVPTGAPSRWPTRRGAPPLPTTALPLTPPRWRACRRKDADALDARGHRV